MLGHLPPLTTELLISEVFGPTVQGEGPSAGRRCAFVRLGLCNLRCKWCDTPYTWDWTGVTGKAYDRATELAPRTAAAVAAQVAGMGVGMVVVTGGEPLLQQDALGDLLSLLPAGMRVEVETNGTKAPTAELAARVDAFNVSPKLAHSGDPKHRRIVPAALAALQATGKAAWKFVAASPADLDAIARVVDEHGLSPVYVMPLGVSRDVVRKGLAALAEPAIARGWNLTPRLHVELWGERRGV